MECFAVGACRVSFGREACHFCAKPATGCFMLACLQEVLYLGGMHLRSCSRRKETTTGIVHSLYQAGTPIVIHGSYLDVLNCYQVFCSVFIGAGPLTADHL